MFRIAKQRLYWRTVTIWQPGEDGSLAEAKFEAQLRYLPDREHRAMMDRAAAERLPDRDVVPEILASFRGVQAEDGSDLPYSAESLEQLLREPLVASAIVRTYLDSRAEAAQKNFARPPESGPVVAPSTTTAH